MKQKNSTFRGGRPTWANACVGDNGVPSYVEYALGFSKAANVLIDQVLGSNGDNYNVDDFVYPVCFNMRHSVELRLKGAIAELKVISGIKGGQLNFDLIGSHDIGNIWKFFKHESEKIDIRYASVNTHIEPTILDIAEVDATGQTFRYPTDNESQKHLTDVALINFFILKKKFNQLEKNLNNLFYLSEYLIEEYSLRTFTAKLSRKQLFDLAEDLPEISSWKNESFRQKKIYLRDKYSLTSNDLTKAINVIKDNYELSSKLNLRLPLKGVDEYDLIWFLDFWIEVNPEIKNRKERYSLSKLDTDEIFNSLRREQKAKVRFWSTLDGYLTPSLLAGLKALFYFARDKKFSETYVRTFESELKIYEIYNHEGIDGLKQSFMHLVEKANFFDNLVVSLFFLDYGDLAEELVDIYGVSEAFDWLDKVRSREIFMLPKLAGY